MFLTSKVNGLFLLPLFVYFTRVLCNVSHTFGILQVVCTVLYTVLLPFTCWTGVGVKLRLGTVESMKWFTKDQAFSPSYDLAPPPTPRPLPPVSSASDTQENKERETTSWQERVGEDPNHTTARKHWSSINPSILSQLGQCLDLIITLMTPECPLHPPAQPT